MIFQGGLFVVSNSAENWKWICAILDKFFQAIPIIVGVVKCADVIKVIVKMNFIKKKNNPSVTVSWIIATFFVHETFVLIFKLAINGVALKFTVPC